MTEKILKSFWLHPFRWLVFFVIILISLFVICSGPDKASKQTPIQTETEPQRPVIEPVDILPQEQGGDQGATGSTEPNQPPAQVENPDPIKADESPSEVAEGKKIALKRAALPFLPLKAKNVLAEYKNQLSNGDLVIEVKYRGSKAAAIKEWQNFLNKYQDPGTAYLVIYKPV